MKVTICAVGKLKSNAPEVAIFEKYAKMLKWDVEVKEVLEAKNLPLEKLIANEGEKLLKVIPKDAFKVVLDETGKMLSSVEFAEEISKIRDQGKSDIAFLIGGANGHAESIVKEADLVLSLGKMVWPHFLVRPMLMEQIYRAKTIIEGHPYHRD
ncbi:MAG: 23S rRNA (pseudouridine(1915)-N(3))-methyltransferase RlmH [Alphaproteobacteria bacterium]